MNLANLVGAVDSIPTNTLAGLKAALKNGTAQEKFPIGHEIPDTYAGNSNPLIVAQYLDNTNNSAYGGAVGVILIRKYVEPIAQEFGRVSYIGGSMTPQSAIKTFLETTYLNNCSDTTKSLISNIDIPYWYDNSTYSVPSTWFLMSAREVMSVAIVSKQVEGIGWQYWKDKTGLSAPDQNSNPGRIVTNRSGTAQYWWLRSIYSTRQSTVCLVHAGGSTYYGSPSDKRGVLPACFISKD